MDIALYFPSKADGSGQVDPAFEDEYKAACETGQFKVALIDYERLIEGGGIAAHADGSRHSLFVYRGWMLKPESYEYLQTMVECKDRLPLTSPEAYRRMHCFPNIYNEIISRAHTPRIIVFGLDEGVPADRVNAVFKRFMVKDAVKSVKGLDFPAFIETPISQDDLDALIARFKRLRGSLLTDSIVLKEYVDLKRYGGVTNEWRAFYLVGELLSLRRNSNQPETCARPPQELIESFTSGIDASYYTVDFAELEDGSWIVVETGDGQVSGLSPNQDPYAYYMRFAEILNVLPIMKGKNGRTGQGPVPTGVAPQAS